RRRCFDRDLLALVLEEFQSHGIPPLLSRCHRTVTPPRVGRRPSTSQSLREWPASRLAPPRAQSTPTPPSHGAPYVAAEGDRTMGDRRPAPPGRGQTTTGDCHRAR